MSNLLGEDDLKDIIQKSLGDRKRWQMLGWNEGPKEKSVVRYRDETMSSDHVISAKVIHLWAEMELDKSFGIFPEVLGEVIHDLSGLIVVFKRPTSRICIIYRLGRLDMSRSRDFWGTGKDDQVQIPIRFFTKLDEIEWP